jgi:hypothetical protein
VSASTLRDVLLAKFAERKGETERFILTGQMASDKEAGSDSIARNYSNQLGILRGLILAEELVKEVYATLIEERDLSRRDGDGATEQRGYS